MGLLPAELTASLGWEDQTLETSWNQSGHLHRSDSFGKKCQCLGSVASSWCAKLRTARAPVYLFTLVDGRIVFFFFTSNPVGFLWVCTLQFTKTSRSTKTQILGRCSARVWHRSWKAATSRSCALWNGQVGRTDGWQAVIELNHGRANHYILARSKNFKTLELHRQIMAINEVSNKYLPKIWQI
jgi:hypothetical protein